MRLLITGDLHARWDWYVWLLKEAKGYDALVVAGDFLDLSLEESPLHQMVNVVEWSVRLAAQGTPLIFCSGNHDLNQEELSLDAKGMSPFELKKLNLLYQNKRWMDAIQGKPKWMGDRFVGLLENSQNEKLVVTCLPYHQEGISQPVFNLMEAGKALAHTSKSQWLVLNHCSAFDGGSGGIDCQRLLRDYHPNFMASGHHHGAPFRLGSGHKQVCQTQCFNAGYNDSGDYPCHITLDLDSNSTWCAEWQPNK